MRQRLEGALHFYTKYMAVWTFLLGVVAYFTPAPFTAARPFMNMFFALTMFGIGAALHMEDFARVARQPTAVLIGVISQFTIMPLGAFLLAKVLRLSPAIAVGLILTGCAPGAMASNVVSYIARADAAYSVSLTAVSTLLTPVVMPALTYVLARSILDVNFWEIFLSVVNMVVVPLVLGFCFRHFFRRIAERITKVFPAISVTFIMFICALVIALNKAHLAQITFMVLAAVIMLNVGGMLMGYGVGTLWRFGVKRRRALSIEIGMQNAGLGTVLALRHFGPETAIPAAAFVFVCIFTAAIMAEIWRGRMEPSF